MRCQVLDITMATAFLHACFPKFVILIFLLMKNNFNAIIFTVLSTFYWFWVLCIIIWQSSLRQIRAFWLVPSWSGFCHTDRFHENSPSRVFFSKAGKFKFPAKPTKIKRVLSFFANKLPNRLIFTELITWTKKTNINQAKFNRIILKFRKILMWKLNTHHRKPGGHIDDFISERKTVNAT